MNNNNEFAGAKQNGENNENTALQVPETSLGAIYSLSVRLKENSSSELDQKRCITDISGSNAVSEQQQQQQQQQQSDKEHCGGTNDNNNHLVACSANLEPPSLLEEQKQPILSEAKTGFLAEKDSLLEDSPREACRASKSEFEFELESESESKSKFKSFELETREIESGKEGASSAENELKQRSEMRGESKEELLKLALFEERSSLIDCVKVVEKADSNLRSAHKTGPESDYETHFDSHSHSRFVAAKENFSHRQSKCISDLDSDLALESELGSGTTSQNRSDHSLEAAGDNLKNGIQSECSPESSTGDKVESERAMNGNLDSQLGSESKCEFESESESESKSKSKSKLEPGSKSEFEFEFTKSGSVKCDSKQQQREAELSDRVSQSEERVDRQDKLACLAATTTDSQLSIGGGKADESFAESIEKSGNAVLELATKQSICFKASDEFSKPARDEFGRQEDGRNVCLPKLVLKEEESNDACDIAGLSSALSEHAKMRAGMNKGESGAKEEEKEVIGGDCFDSAKVAEKSMSRLDYEAPNSVRKGAQGAKELSAGDADSSPLRHVVGMKAGRNDDDGEEDRVAGSRSDKEYSLSPPKELPFSEAKQVANSSSSASSFPVLVVTVTSKGSQKIDTQTKPSLSGEEEESSDGTAFGEDKTGAFNEKVDAKSKSQNGARSIVIFANNNNNNNNDRDEDEDELARGLKNEKTNKNQASGSPDSQVKSMQLTQQSECSAPEPRNNLSQSASSQEYYSGANSSDKNAHSKPGKRLLLCFALPAFQLSPLSWRRRFIKRCFEFNSRFARRRKQK